MGEESGDGGEGKGEMRVMLMRNSHRAVLDSHERTRVLEM
jgi:hypothetical protein